MYYRIIYKNQTGKLCLDHMNLRKRVTEANTPELEIHVAKCTKNKKVSVVRAIFLSEKDQF